MDAWWMPVARKSRTSTCTSRARHLPNGRYEAQLTESREDNYLYRTMGIRATGRQDIQTGEIEKRSLQLLELIDYEEKYEEVT